MKVMNIDVTQRDESVGNFPSSLTRDGFAQFIRMPVPLPNGLEQKGVSKECEPYVKGIVVLDLLFFGDPAFHLSFEQLNEPNSNCSLTDDAVSAAETIYLKECFLSNPVKTDLIGDSCMHGLYAIRSSLTAMLYRDQKISDLESLPVLSELLYAEVLGLGRSNDQGPNPKRVQDLIEQMLELKPNLKSAKRIHFYFEVQDVIQSAKTKTLKDQDKLWENLQSSFEKTKDADGIDDNLPAYTALIQTRGFDPLLTSKYANSLLATNPNSAWGVFLSAYGHWLNDEHEDAFKDLRKAMEMDSKNQGYSRVLSQLMEVGAGNEAFHAGLNLGISLQDFDK